MTKISEIHDDLFTYEIENPTSCVEQTNDAPNNDLGSYEWKMSYEECEKIYDEAVILIDKRLARLIDVTVEQWLDLKYGNHKTMDKNIKKGVIGTWLIRSYKRKFEEYLEIKRQRETYVRDVDMEYNPYNFVFAEWLASKFYNHLEMDWIETNLFDYKTPLCTEFKEFNYLLKVDTELFTHDIERTKTYEDYKNELNDELGEPWSNKGVPYEICDHIYEPFWFKNRKAKWPTCSTNDDGFFDGGELPGIVRVGYMTYFQDYEWSFRNFHELDYELLVKLQDYWWKVNDQECSPFTNWRNHIRVPYSNYYSNAHDEEEQKDKERCELYDNPRKELPIYKIRRFEMIKYSFRQEEVYVAIKEYEYDDLTKTNKDACHAYQEIFRIMDEGWVVTRAE
ncbi:hypothetical protein Tco_1275051 [Tanacetum coccineum]